MYRKLSAPITCQIEVTSACNHNCGHCYNFWRSQKNVPDTHMSIREASIVMKKLVDSGIFSVVLTGGEPLLNLETTLFCAQKATKEGIAVSLNSNLTLLDNSKAKLLKEAGVKSILTSLLSFDALTNDKISGKEGSFEKVSRGIKIALSHELPVTVNMVVSKKNLDHVYETARLVKSLGAKTFTATKAGCPGNCFDFSEYSLNIQEVRYYLNELLKASQDFGLNVDILEAYPVCGMETNFLKKLLGRKCQAGITSMTIASDGSVRPCSHLDTQDGNIFTEKVSDIWNRMSEWREGVHLPKDCKKCKLLPFCNGGCRMESKMLSEKRKFSELDPLAQPERVDFFINELKKINTKATKPERKNPKSFLVVSGLKLRKEPFGATVSVNGKCRLFLDEDGWNIVNQFTLGEIIEIDDPRISWGHIKSSDFILTLAKKKVVKILS